MDYKIIASDLDGTLLCGKDQVSPENWEAIAQLKEQGVHFVPASGRAFSEMPLCLRESPLIRYYINSDGGVIYDKETDTTHELPLPKEKGHQVLDVLYRYPISLMLHAYTGCYVEATHHDAQVYARYNLNAIWTEFALAYSRPTKDLQSFAYSLDRVQSFVPFFQNKADREFCKSLFMSDPELIVAETDPYNLEIFSVAAGKGNALMHLADLLGVDRKATIAVGDSTNDSTMIQAAGLGLVMGNGVPELKAIADQVVCHYKEHVVKYILENIINK